MKTLLLLCGAFLCLNAVAGSQTGKVKTLLVRDDGLHYFVIEGTPSAKPACARNTYWMIRDENSVAGKSQLSLLLTAQASGKPVQIVGNNLCTRWSDGEDVSSVILSD